MDGKDISSFTSLPCGEQQIAQTSNFSHYFIIKRTDNASKNSFKNTLSFLIAKTFLSVLGNVHSIKKLKSGELMVEVSIAIQSNILSSCTVMGTFSVSVEKHKTLNTCRGVISEPDLLYCTREEVLEHFQSQSVFDVHQIIIHKYAQVLPTKCITLTFNSSTLPKQI